MNPIILLIVILSLNSCILDSLSKKTVEDTFTQLDLSDIKVSGEIGRRVDITVANNLMLLDIDDEFLESFQIKNDGRFIGIGKLIDATVKLAVYSGNKDVIFIKNHLVEEIISAQESDGYIGNKTETNRMWQLWDIHEMGYIIIGLLTDYLYFEKQSSLTAAEKSAVYIINNWPSLPAKWEDNTTVATHVAITGIHTAMLTLYKMTGQKKYLEFSLNQHDLLHWDPEIVIGRRKLIEGHVYGYLAACLAQLEMYRIYTDKRLLGPTRKAINFMTLENGMSISGGAGQDEIWTNDQDGRHSLGETCATAYQIRIYDNLLRLTGESQFGDIMERTIYNALFGAQSPDGRNIRYYTPLEGDRTYHKGDTYCCPNNYRRIISELPLMICYRSEKGLAVNLYTSSSVVIPFENNNSVSIKQETDYPNSGHIVLHIDPAETFSFPLLLRIPGWCRDARVTINGIPYKTECTPGKFAIIDRKWKAGDKIILDLPMEWRLVSGKQRQSGRVAVMRGPLLFCLNPLQDESLTHLDGADLGRIVIDLDSIEDVPGKNDDVRPDGITCRLKAGNKPYAMGNAANLSLVLTEFADPDGKCTYFRVPDLSIAVPDELQINMIQKIK